MSDWEHVISERQFGNYTTRYDNGRSYKEGGPRSVTAHTKSGKNVGYLLWNDAGNGEGQHGDHPTIDSVRVNKPQQRKGLASAMLEHARSIEPALQHSHARTPDGKAWSAARP